ncbi:HU family DNA-binding protein [Clostridium botulinum D/C]|uniref:HU family DNA-binding protein n=1 Tax=Clostridium botulinum TaxID=1491 RepID=UPI001E53CAC4|nr:HU family DNA-binding protein [Clostridium botulinum]MCD3319542.1 HU family DNA-binding protein [Clostridium botulinum D/C]MCD3324880.1 HU family DNA-binding protein [Clostridium botulinum D/C]MCD3327710.1 HU family DNA-binding protein [Clostridium botulinum D/C]
MVKSELVGRMVEKLEGKEVKVSRKEMDAIYSVVLETVAEVVKEEGKLTTPIGTFKNTTRGARVGRNPKTGEELQIPECHALTFKQSRSIKEQFNK